MKLLVDARQDKGLLFMGYLANGEAIYEIHLDEAIIQMGQEQYDALKNQLLSTDK